MITATDLTTFLRQAKITLFVALLSPVLAHGQSASQQLGVDVSHPNIQQRSSSSQSGGGQSRSNSSGDTASQISTYNTNHKKIAKSLKLRDKAASALRKEKWVDAAKFYGEALTNLPTNFNGGVGSDKQELIVAKDKASWGHRHAFCMYKMGQLELAASEFQWVIENNMYADPQDLEDARISVTIIQQRLYDAAMEKKRQEALKLHNSDFHPPVRVQLDTQAPPSL